MLTRLGLRLDAADRRHLVTIAEAMNATEASNALPWHRGATMSRAVRLALAIAADAVQSGDAAAFLVRGGSGTDAPT